jgi:hypothetical protein
MSSLLERKMVCQDRLLVERVEQALAEAGKSANVAAVVAGLVAAAEFSAGKAPTSSEVTDDEIIAFVRASA